MNIGAGEILMIAVLALLIFGPKRLPEIGKQVAKGLREFRRAANDLKSELKSGLDEGSTNNSTSSVGKSERTNSAAKPAGEVTNSKSTEDKEPRPGPRG
jgi:sec-independent protein translocase protein TatA